MKFRFRETVESSGFYTPEEWKYELEYLGYRKCDKCGKVNSTLVESVNYDELIYYIVDGIQEVYRLQGVLINDKHIEIIVRQMMQKIEVSDSGDSLFLHGDRINKIKFLKTVKSMLKKVVVINSGDSDYDVGDVVLKDNINDINSDLKTDGKKVIKFSI